MSQHEHDDNDIELEPVGKTLRALREQKNLGINDICARLHLDARIIQGIEDDSYDRLPDPIYIRGYIRSYAKLLGLDPTALVEAYNRNVRCTDPEIIPEVRFPTQTSSSDKPVKAFSYLIVFGLLLLLFAWWQSNFIVDGNSADTKGPVVTFPENAAPRTSPAPQPAPIPYEVPPQESLPVTNSFDDPTGLSIASTGMDTVPETDSNGMPAEAATDSPNPEVIDDASTDPLVEPQTLTDPATVVETTQDPVAGMDPVTMTVGMDTPLQDGPDSLILTIKADSWIEIDDAEDRKIYFNLARTGDTLRLRGTAPFDVLLGFAQGVSIDFNGKAIDPSPHTRAGVARFSIGE